MNKKTLTCDEPFEPDGVGVGTLLRGDLGTRFNAVPQHHILGNGLTLRNGNYPR